MGRKSDQKIEASTEKEVLAENDTHLRGQLLRKLPSERLREYNATRRHSSRQNSGFHRHQQSECPQDRQQKQIRPDVVRHEFASR